MRLITTEAAILGVVTVVVFVAKQPARNAAIIIRRWTLHPSGCAVLESTNMRRLVGGLSFVRTIVTIVVAIALPQFRNTLSVGAPELRLRVTLPLMTDALVFVTTVRAIVIRVAYPRVRHTAAS